MEREKARTETGGRPGKSDWFRKTGASAVLTVPATEGGRLAEKVREALAASPNPSGCTTLVREQPGPSVRQALVKSNPRPRDSCGRALCPYASSGRKCRGRCYRESIAYMGRCLRCAESQKQEGRQEDDIVWETYQGETSRSIVSRSREHFDDYKAAMRKQPSPPGRPLARQAGRLGQGEEMEEEEGSSSWMADHALSHHMGKISKDPRQDYNFVVLNQFRKPLERQIEEAVRIKYVMSRGFLVMGQGRRAKKVKMNRRLLNRKMENFSPWFLTMGGGED